MNIKASYSVPAPRDKVFAAITNPATLQRVIDGCEKMVQTGENAYDVHLKIGVAGLKGNYVGKVQLKDLQPPESYTMLLEGKGGPGFVKGTARLEFLAQGDLTELRCDADVQVGGLIAAIGSRLVEAAAKKMMDEFFRKFVQTLKEA